MVTLVSHACPFLTPLWTQPGKRADPAGCCQQALAQAVRASSSGEFGLRAALQERNGPPRPLLPWDWGRQVPVCSDGAVVTLLLPSAASRAGRLVVAGSWAGGSVPLLGARHQAAETPHILTT